MADPRMTGGRRGIAQRAYAPRPVRSRAMRLGAWAGVCALCFSAGAAAMFGYWRHGSTNVEACAASVLPDRTQLELERTRLALAQEAASRAAVQKAADAATAQVARLDAEVRFLQGQERLRR